MDEVMVFLQKMCVRERLNGKLLGEGSLFKIFMVIEFVKQEYFAVMLLIAA